MKPRQLPQPVLSRWLDLSERVEMLEQEALAAESEVARLRMLLKTGNANPDTLAEVKAAQASFDGVYGDAQIKRSRATAQGKLLATVKAWIEQLTPGARLTLVSAPLDGASLSQVRGELAALRSDLSKLRGTPPASLDIGKRIDALVAEWAEAARPMVRGFANGQALDVRWPMSVDANRQNGNNFHHNEANALLLFAALMPSELGELIFKAIQSAQPLSAYEHSERMLKLNARVNELSYLECALVERDGGEHSVEAAPHCILGVRVGETETGEAAA
jgi:hypothetical protein